MNQTQLSNLESLLYQAQGELTSDEDKESISSVIELCQSIEVTQ